MHNYLSGNDVFPAGGLYANDAFAATGGTVLRSNYVGWAVAILPFIEQAPLFNAYNSDVHNWHIQNSTHIVIGQMPSMNPVFSWSMRMNLRIYRSGRASAIMKSPTII